LRQAHELRARTADRQRGDHLTSFDSRNTVAIGGQVLACARSAPYNVYSGDFMELRASVWLLSALWLAVLPGVPVAAQAPRAVDAVPIITGAILAEGFDQPELDSRVWHRPDWLVRHNPYIGVAPEHGQLHLSGISRPSGAAHQYVGILSSNYRETDVVLAANMRVASAFDREGRIQHFVHLCTGDWPDFFSEVVFGRIRDGPPVWAAGNVHRVFQYDGHDEYLQPIVAASGKEHSDWHQVVIDHDGDTGETTNYVTIDGQLRQVGPTVRIPFNHTHVELKVDVNIPDARIRMDVDNVRLYVRPARHPVDIIVSSPIVRGTSVPPIEGLRVRLTLASSGRLLGEAATNVDGEARILLPPDLIYPVDARITVSDGRTTVLESRIPSSGVAGLYPGDVWMVRFPAR
jgi:hypothetical protein